MVRLSWKAGPEQFAPDVLLECAVVADEAGFDSIDVSDHFHPWSEEGQACFTWTWLGAAAARTNRITLGTGVTCPTLRYHPSIIAQAAATLSVLAPGRTFLGLGTGEALNEYSATSQWPGYRDRQARLREAIDLIRRLWTGEPVTFEGAHYKTRKARLYTPPSGVIPVYVSALVPGSAAFAGEQGDGLITVGGQEPDLYQQIMHQFDRGAEAVGKRPDRLPRAIEINVAFTDDVEQASQDMLNYWAGAFVPAMFNERLYTPSQSAENGKVVGQDTLQKTMCISADPAEHVRFAQRYLDLGFDEIFFHSAEPDQQGFLERYGREVLPRLRQAVEPRRRAA
jgi:coenzyme F420-dependent glucose-6-phosphate dehydrogenase